MSSSAVYRKCTHKINFRHLILLDFIRNKPGLSQFIKPFSTSPLSQIILKKNSGTITTIKPFGFSYYKSDFISRLRSSGTEKATNDNIHGLSDYADMKLPRRLVKRLKKLGISESEFLSRLDHQRNQYDDHNKSNIIDTVDLNMKFSGTQEELEKLIQDMSKNSSKKPNIVSEIEDFPSDMAKFNELERKNMKSAGQDSKLRVDPSTTSVLLFPGQGSQFVGMAKKLVHFPSVNDLFEEASSILGYDLLKLCLHGPKSELDKTVHCQPAVLVSSIACLEKMREEHSKSLENCVATAGFSVGEFSSLVFSGVLSFPEAVEVIKKRAEAMQSASEDVNSGMMSVFLAHDSELKAALKMAKDYCTQRHGIQEPVCQVANFLFPECKVIAGHSEALEFISTNAKEFHLLRTKRLAVSGAFHTGLMKAAVQPLENVLKKVKLKQPELPVYSNVSGHAYAAKTNFVHRLGQQLVKPVKWEQIMHDIYQREQGTPFPMTFELGPGKQLGTLLKQVNVQAFRSYQNIET